MHCEASGRMVGVGAECSAGAGAGAPRRGEPAAARGDGRRGGGGTVSIDRKRRIVTWTAWSGTALITWRSHHTSVWPSKAPVTCCASGSKVRIFPACRPSFLATMVHAPAGGGFAASSGSHFSTILKSMIDRASIVSSIPCGSSANTRST